MKKMAVILSSFATAMAAVMSQPVLAQSQGGTDTVLYHRDVITNQATLFQRAEHGVTDWNGKNHSVKAVLQNLHDGNSTNVRTISTTQYVSDVKKANGEDVKTYVTTDFAVVPTSTLASGGSQTTSSSVSQATSTGGSQTTYAFDPSSTVKAYLTIWWNNVTPPNNDLETQLTEVGGGWVIYDQFTSVSNELVNYGASGYSYPSGMVTQASDNNHPSGLTFTYYPPGSWVPISTDNSYYLRSFGAYSSCQVNVPGQSYQLSLSDNT